MFKRKIKKENNSETSLDVLKDVILEPKKNKKKIPLWIVIIMAILDLGAIGCLVLAYGPNEDFKEFLITTAMSTMNHKYLARTIYDEETINKVLRENTIIEIDEVTNPDEIQIGSYETKNYESKYEEQILKKDPNNDVYKLLKIKENNNTYHIAVIYDPSRISLAFSSTPGVRGEKVKTIANRNKALLAINASGFEDAKGEGNGAYATGVVIHNGKVVYRGKPNHWGGGLVGFDKNHKLVLTKKSAEVAIKNGMWDAIQFGPFLIVNGKEASIKGSGGGVHPRTIIAQRRDGIVLFIVIDGTGVKKGYRGGASFKEVIKVLKRYKVYNAANLDGGASSILIEKDKIVNNPVGYSATGERFHPNAWIVK